MKSDEVPAAEAVLNQSVTEAEIEQLTARDHAMLRLGELPDSEGCLVRPPQRIRFAMHCVANLMACPMTLRVDVSLWID